MCHRDFADVPKSRWTPWWLTQYTWILNTPTYTCKVGPVICRLITHFPTGVNRKVGHLGLNRSFKSLLTAGSASVAPSYRTTWSFFAKKSMPKHVITGQKGLKSGQLRVKNRWKNGSVVLSHGDHAGGAQSDPCHGDRKALKPRLKVVFWPPPSQKSMEGGLRDWDSVEIARIHMVFLKIEIDSVEMTIIRGIEISISTILELLLRPDQQHQSGPQLLHPWW